MYVSQNELAILFVLAPVSRHSLQCIPSPRFAFMMAHRLRKCPFVQGRSRLLRVHMLIFQGMMQVVPPTGNGITSKLSCAAAVSRASDSAGVSGVMRNVP